VGGPSWLADTLAAVMIVITFYCAGRLIVSLRMGRHTEFDADGLHVAMGAAMAGMLVPRLNPLPGSVWEVVFGIAAVWFAGQATLAGRARGNGSLCSYPVPHLIECAAMLYMFLAMPASGHAGHVPVPMPGMTSASGTFPAVAMVFALFMLGHVVWSADRLAAATRARTAAAARSAAPDHNRVPVSAGVVPPTWQSGAVGTCEAASTRPEHPDRRPILAPRLGAAYKIVMSITMGYMLVLML